MNLQVHEQIIRDALGDERTMSQQALKRIIAANKLSDLYQFTPERHFDNAPDHETLRVRWQHGLRTYLDRAIELSAPAGKTLARPKSRMGALGAFGTASHALADFYAHTNWVELMVAQKNPELLAPLLGETWQSNAFPPQLESGYFNLRYGLCGCPKTAGRLQPPPGYRYCHEQLAKDHPDRGHGQDRSSADGPTYHELAVLLAIKATRELWQTLHHSIIERYSSTTSIDAEELFQQLAGIVSTEG